MSQTNHNPYNYLTPIQDPQAFFGREEQLRAVCEGIAQKKQISLVGAPRCGLSSLLNRLMALPFQAECEALAGPLQFIHVNCNQFDDPLLLLHHLLPEVAPGSPVTGMPGSRLYWTFLTALRKLREKRLVVLFDDFEHIGLNGLFLDFVDSLRGMAQEVGMTLIVATHIPLHKACHKDLATSPFPSMFDRPIRINPFTQAECAQFLQTTSAISGVTLAPYAEQILSLGGRWPCFLQMACAHYYQAVVGGAKPDHEAIAARFVSEAAPHFGHIWQGLEAEEKAVLRDLANGKRPLDRRVDDLVEKGYIILEDKVPKVFSEAFGRFVRDSG